MFPKAVHFNECYTNTNTLVTETVAETNSQITVLDQNHTSNTYGYNLVIAKL